MREKVNMLECWHMSWGKRIGIDLGTANSLVWVAGRGIVLNEPTVVAVSVEDMRVVAVGHEAKTMLGRTPGNIIASRPMKDGVIADYAITEALIRFFIQKAVGKNLWLKPEVMICVPAGCTQVERRAAVDATMAAGAKATYLIDEPLAAAIGAGVPIAEASGNMILDVGGGSAETAVISLGGVVAHKSVRVGGNKLDEAIMDFARRNHALVIGDQTAEMVKIKIGSAIKLPREESIQVKGRDTVTGLPRTITLTSSDVYQALTKPLAQIVGVVKAVLEETPPELSSDIIDRGIVMSGGTATLRNLDTLLTREVGVPAYLAEEPLLCVVKGTGKAIENIDTYRRALR
ncbi:MAG: MreB/Mrl family cell shape determining protein, rod shape-determining protein MreB [Microgenomates group bacterium GW2011_GWC1_46_16]|nr:MAG: Cell shape determining protein, MreB/Mrl family [Microgenomates group bacterium GW2011_GWF1_46_12]KKU26634.1 MAG: MreB/Mrl family cell shape determining protein, rod shape-determining protein MreB [Microgenomates group bacterium GW2011_GWC1_46_16]KKU28112.1 MAG: Cell shape determining protein, MreB/Mrl family [Microgenomates group bacterium GW2011_GWF2_46_18]KKU42867.1 MAG: Cell shape determining protein, MreB/Mrl family [Microgenomates group bacterium GW2011_GWA1_46_7]KKU62851.1 MAG: C